MKKVILLAIVALCFSATAFAQNTTMQKHHHKMMHTMYTCPMHPEVMQNKAGKCPKCNMDLVKATMPMYTCKMHPKVIKNKSGKCPKCGKDLTKKEDMKGMKM